LADVVGEKRDLDLDLDLDLDPLSDSNMVEVVVGMYLYLQGYLISAVEGTYTRDDKVR
jgi:hypothetical protein